MGELDDLILRARRRLNFENTTAYLGDGSGRIYSGDKYLVRLKLASGFSDPFPVAAHPNANLPERDGLPVLLGTDEFGRDVILRAHYDVAGVAGTSSIIYNPLSNAAYGTVDSSKLTPFLWRIHPDETGKPFTVYVVVPLVLLTSSVVYPVTLEIDLASFVPAAGDHRFVCVFWKTDNTLAAYASTARHELDPLVESDMLQCVSAAPADAVPVCGWILTGGETALSKRPDRSFDMRQFVNLPGSGGGGTVTSVGLAAPSDLLNVSGSPVTSSGTLTLAKPTDTAANRVYASPDGTAGAAAFRALASGDLPVVPISKGGTGQTTAAAGFNALSPLTTQGDLLTHNGTESVRLPIGGRGMLVHSNGAPTWYNTEYDRILDMKASGTAGGGSTAGSWQTRTLNTIELGAGFILALTGSAFRLKEGKYHIHVVSPFVAGTSGTFVVRLRLARNGFAEIVGTNISAAAGSGAPLTAMLSGVFTVINIDDSYSIQYYTGSARATNGLGAALSVTGESETYTIVTLMRLLP